MIHVIRQLAALMVAFALVFGSFVPPSPATAGVVPAAAAVTHDAMPCHGDPDGATAQPCPFVAVCAAKCFHAVPTVAAVIAMPLGMPVARIATADRRAGGLSPAPLPEIPRA